jgi:hypothetical protein
MKPKANTTHVTPRHIWDGEDNAQKEDGRKWTGFICFGIGTRSWLL